MERGMKVSRKKVIEDILRDFPETRDNDNELIFRYLKTMGMPTDYNYLRRQYKVNIAESIRRTRQKIQERNPLLKASEPVQLNRLNLERTIRETMRGV